MSKYHKGAPPFDMNIWVEGKPPVVLQNLSAAQVVGVATKFAGRLPNKSEGATLLDFIGSTIKEPMQSFWCCSAADWRISFSGALGVEGAGELVEENS